MSKNARAITDLRYYKNLTKKGNPTATRAKQGLNYYTFQRDEANKQISEMRGQWWDRKGSRCTVPEMTKWIVEKSKENKYTYTAVLSLRDGKMATSDFVQAMNNQSVFSDYRLIKHNDTDHVHAHVMMFSKKTISKKQFYQWRRDVGSELEMLEVIRLEQTRQWEIQETARRAVQAKMKKQKQASERETNNKRHRHNDFGLG